MVDTLRQDTRVAALHSPFGQDVLGVARVDVGEGLSELFEIRIEAYSHSDDLDFSPHLGSHFWLVFSTGSGMDRVFDGLLVEAQRLGTVDDLTTYRMVLKPWLWMLSRTSNSRIHSNSSLPGGGTAPGITPPDIIATVFRNGGFSDFRLELSEMYWQLEYCVQYRETDLAFVSRLMEQFGIYYYFEHEQGKHTMVLTDSKTSHRPLPGKFATIPFAPFVENERPSTDRIYRVVGQRRLRTAHVVLNEYDYLNPKTTLLADVSSSPDPLRGAEFYDYPGKYIEQDQGETLARVRLQAEQCLDHRRQAAGDIINVVPGGSFTLSRHTVESENIPYLVVRATHSYVAEAYRSTDGADDGGSTYFGNYELLPLDIPFRAQQLTPRPIIQGPQTAKVVGASGEEIDVDEHGRILVHFYWEREKATSCRVRLAQVWAGRKWGGIFIPRVDQEVIVEFLEGDPDRPLVIGTVYNGDNKVPYDLPSEKTIGGIKSDSTKGGGGYNEFVFDDQKGEELIRGHAEKDLEFEVEVDERWKIRNDSRTDVGNNIDVTSGNTITITADTQIELKVGQNNIVITQAGITIKGLVTQVDGSTLLDLNGGLITIN